MVNVIKKILEQPITAWLYQRPVLVATMLSILSGLYLIADFGIVNASALSPLWQLEQLTANETASAYTIFSLLGTLSLWMHQLLGLPVHIAAYGILLIVHAGIIALVIMIARQLQLALLTQWILIFLLLCHPNYSDFRTYIMNEPIYWLLWLFAVYILIRFHRQRAVMTGIVWIVIFLLAGQLSLSAWFWLLLFPFGAFLVKEWRRKGLLIALICYGVIVTLLMLLPLYQGQSPFSFFVDMLRSSHSMTDWLLVNATWLNNSDRLIPMVFVLSGAISIVMIHMLMALGLVCAGLAAYGWRKKQHQIIYQDYIKLLIYLILFDMLVSAILWVVAINQTGLYFFSSVFLMFIFAALGLSYVIKKIKSHGYSRHLVLIIIWCLVAYFASGYIIFGPKKHHIKAAGQYAHTQLTAYPVYSNDTTFLFYSGQNPDNTATPEFVENIIPIRDFYYAYHKNRKHALPAFLSDERPVLELSNRHKDTLYIYKFD